MRVIVNGLEREVQDGITLAELLAEEREPARHVLVEVNGVYLPADRYAGRVLAEGDRVEVIHPAFGG